jgi:hypothetical protein
LQRVLTALGRPFADEKRQKGAQQSDFLGLTHDMSRAMQGTVAFWPRQKLRDRFADMMSTAVSHNYFPPGQASKVYGLWNFLETGAFGQVGRAGMHALRRRQYTDQSPYVVTMPLRATFDMLTAILSLNMQRLSRASSQTHKRFAAASDAAADNPQRASGGFLLAFQPGPRLAGVSTLDKGLYDWLTPSAQQIAQWELLQVLIALPAYPDKFRGQAGVWWIDNFPALFALVKGKVMSKTFSRQSKQDKWNITPGFVPAYIAISPFILDFNLKTSVRIFSFL